MRGGHRRQPGIVPSSMPDAATDRTRQRILSVSGNGSSGLTTRGKRDHINRPCRCAGASPDFALNCNLRSHAEFTVSQLKDYMSIPDYQSLMLPLLKTAADGKEHTKREVLNELAKHFG